MKFVPCIHKAMLLALAIPFPIPIAAAAAVLAVVVTPFYSLFPNFSLLLTPSSSSSHNPPKKTDENLMHFHVHKGEKT